MSTKPRPSGSAQHRRPSEDRARRTAPAASDRAAAASVAPRILDAVHDQHGGRWIRYGTPRQAIWFGVADLISEGAEVFRRLATVGKTCLTTASQSALKREIEARADYRAALVAKHPGWLEGFYVFGDGTLATPQFDEREVIVTFEPNPKFTPRGPLVDWQRAIAPFVADQPLSYFVIALALSGPLQRFAPSGYLSPQAELVGQPESGKSSIATVAASVWAGNPGSDCGGGELWDMTLNALDPLKLAHRDNFLFLDESNLVGGNPRERRDFAAQAVFKFAATGGKRRMGDPVQGEHARLAMLSTTNKALADLVEDTADVRDAARSRMITIRIAADAPHGIFAMLPPGYATARAASEAMRNAADQLWGEAGRGFVAHLVGVVERDEARLRRDITRGLANYMRRDRVALASARAQKTFALVAVTAALAQRAGILPKAWGSPFDMIQAVARASSGEPADAVDPLAAVRTYVEGHRVSLTEVATLAGPVSRAEFDAAPGFLRWTHGHPELLIPAARFQVTFPEHEAMMRALRDAGLAQTEGGLKPKLTIKTPRSVCGDGRVYCIRLEGITV